VVSKLLYRSENPTLAKALTKVKIADSISILKTDQNIAYKNSK
jgi:hypothetical protein